MLFAFSTKINLDKYWIHLVLYRGMLETAGIMMSERSIHYDMSKFYPGLQLRVGPTAVGGGILEFHMDSNVRYDERHDDVPSTGEINEKKNTKYNKYRFENVARVHTENVKVSFCSCFACLKTEALINLVRF